MIYSIGSNDVGRLSKMATEHGEAFLVYCQRSLMLVACLQQHGFCVRSYSDLFLIEGPKRKCSWSQTHVVTPAPNWNSTLQVNKIQEQLGGSVG